jgi:2-polyprenyl-3-methyl-5-hydroxy-6-metoxy-1,4-benzoquinol methylase
VIDINRFRSLSKYERKVDLKKLKFIYNAVADYIRESSKEPEKLKILEIGCGDGSITLPLSAFGGTVTSFDIDDTLVCGVKQEIEKRRISNISVLIDNAYTFAMNEKYDVVIASEVLEHLDYPEKVIANLKKHLVRGGYCIVTIPNGYGPWELSNKIKKIFSLKSAKDNECGHKHVQFFTMSRFLGMFSANDLRLIRFGKSDAFSGLSYCIAKKAFIANADLMLADLLPSRLVSGWYFVFENDEASNGS